MTQLSLIFPVYNERLTIETVLQEWMVRLKQLKINYEMVVCEDGSTDGTSQLLRAIKNKYRLVLNQSVRRRGYGPAVIDGIKTAKGEYLLSVDSDGQCDPADFISFWKRRGARQVIIGWRKKRVDAPQRLLFSYLFHQVFSRLFPTSIHDPSAPFVLYRKKDIIPHLDSLVFLKEGFWWGFVAMCVKNKIPLIELPIHHRARLNGNTQVYRVVRLPKIIWSNLFGLIRLRLA
ncbi:glycosyltransferase family 2 protein [Patescibacteria group bacterium]|nr:glycosyltransferase family 2 protein [Patescibacteria group bacterium]MCL5091854.1 glycosyltransferase family 2 protein [Patescibacteria group bacterium]